MGLRSVYEANTGAGRTDGASAGRAGAGAPDVAGPGAEGLAGGPAEGLERDDFRALLEAAPGAYLVLRADPPRFTIAAASDAYLRATHLTREAAVGRGVFEVLPDANPANAHASGVANLRASLDAVLRTGAPHRMAVQRYDLRRPDGTWEERHWAPHNVPVTVPARGRAGDAAGAPVRYLLHHVEDVTARVRGEAALREAEEERRRLEAERRQQYAAFDAVLARLQEHVYLLDLDGRFRYANQPLLDLWGRTLDQAVGKTLADLGYPAELVCLHDAQLRRAIETRSPVEGANAYTSPAGVTGHYEYVFVPLLGPDGSVVAVGGRTQAVTEHRRAAAERERLLAEREQASADAESARAAVAGSESKFRFALAVADLGAWDLDLATQRAWRSPRHDQIFGYDAPPPEWTYERFLAHVVPEDRARVDASYGGALAAGAPWAFTCRIRRADGAERWIAARGEPIRDAAGAPVRLVGVVQDVTAEHEAQAALRAAVEAAEAASRAKSEFLAVMSHELRTPLNAIGGYAELLELGIRGPVTEQQREDLRRIQTSQRHLLGLINEVLNYARLESGAVHYATADVPVADALRAAEGLVAPQARAKGLALGVADCPPDAGGRPLTVRADPDKLRQVLLNLLSNAVKFTDRGGAVDVGCAVVAGARVAIRVRDTGIGIPADKLAAVFEPFVQVRADLTRPHEGTGLGLAISRDLARGMGGDLTVESTPGVGSTFILTLP